MSLFLNQSQIGFDHLKKNGWIESALKWWKDSYNKIFLEKLDKMFAEKLGYISSSVEEYPYCFWLLLMF